MNILIFGGSTDIGINLASYLKNKGYTPIITYNNHKVKLNDIESIHCDIKNEEEIDYIIKYVLDKYKKIDILINLASISYDNDLMDTTKKDFMNALEVNLVGNFLTSKIYSKYINDGVIINMSSTDGIDTYSKHSMIYSASKAGLINLSKSMSLNTDNKILCICPNWIDSESTRSMDKTYLDNELKRINQSRLITIDELNESIYKIIKMDTTSGSVMRIDIKGDKLWIEKVS